MLRRLAGIVWEFATSLFIAGLAAFTINVFVAEGALIEQGPSMQPNLYVGYRVMTEKVTYHFREPQRGDVVVINRPAGETALIKRVIGLPGETVSVIDGHAYINGEPIAEPWVSYFGGRDCPPTYIPPGYFFAIGDNRRDSLDSRALGPFAEHDIRGHAFIVYWPPDEIKLLR